MAKTKISEFSSTPANNTDIDSINIAEGCAPSGINDAIRELMAQLKDFQTGAQGDSFNGPIGTSTAAAGAFTTLSASSTATLSGLTASTALALDASKNVVSVTNTGTGNNVLATSPTLVTPILGTPTSATLTNATGLPIATGVSGLGTGVATFLATPSSANLAAALTDETGSGANVFATSPTLVTPTLGVATATSLQGIIGNVTPAAGSFTTVDASGSVTLSGGTTNGVTYLNGSKVLTSGSALTFDGTNFATSGTSTASKLIPTGTSVTGNGMYLPATNSLGFSTAGVNAAYIDANQNVGIGITPSAWRSSFNVTYGERVLELTYSALVTQAGPNTILANNVYFNSSNQWIYKNAVANTNAGLYTIGSNGVHSWSVAPTGASGAVATFTQAMTLTAAGNLQLGATTGTEKLTLANGAGVGAALVFWANGVGAGSELYVGQGGSNEAYFFNRANSFTAFGTNNTEKMRLDASGNFLVGKTASDVTVAGTQIESTGTVGIVRNGAVCLIANRLTDDGTLVSLRQASTEEGTISVSGTTVSYNGGHLSRWAQMLTTPELFKGTVMSNLDEMNVYTKDGQPVANEQLNKVKVSDTEGDVNVAGVFVNWSHDEDHNVDEINMAMTGDMIIRIAQGVTVVRGDLLMSAGDGTAKPQGDDIIRSKTVAKVTSNHVTCTYADGSYCVPCVLMAC